VQIANNGESSGSLIGYILDQGATLTMIDRVEPLHVTVDPTQIAVDVL